MAKTIQQSTDVISTLNRLIEAARDGQDGFAKAAENLQNSSYKSFCMDQSQTYAQFVSELQQKVRQLGGNPETAGSTTAAMYRAWVDIKSALGGGDHSVMAWCENGVDSAVTEYKGALESGLPENVRDVVERQYQVVEQVHNQVRNIRDSLA